MTVERFCDRCRLNITNRAYQAWTGAITETMESVSNSSVRADLCKPCHTSLRRWLFPSAPTENRDRLLPVDVFYDWLTFGQTGASSKAMVQAVTGDDRIKSGGWCPLDVSDFRRCMLMVDRHPEVRPRFDLVAGVNDTWAEFIRRWDELVALVNTDFPDWRDDDFKYKNDDWWESPSNLAIRGITGGKS